MLSLSSMPYLELREDSGGPGEAEVMASYTPCTTEGGRWLVEAPTSLLKPEFEVFGSVGGVEVMPPVR